MREKPYRCRRHAEGISGQRREKTERIHPAESREPLIEAEAVSLSYDGGEPLLNDIHFKIEPETLYCLMGANGCGKSTLINCILGMHEPDRGEIRIGGRPVSEYRPKELAKRVAFVPQVHERTFPYTVEQVVLMGRNAYSRGSVGAGGHRPENGKRGAGAHRYRASVAAPVYSYQRRRDAAGDAGQSSGTAYVGHYHG